MAPAPAAKALLASHPCYTELAVAPHCDLGCYYCERSVGIQACHRWGPGTAARVLSPAEAAARVEEVARHGWLRVVAIAGPGEPLANPETFETLALVGAAHPDVLLCLSTNGLRLSQALPRLVALGLRALTVTINAVSPAVAERLYEWARVDGERLVGRAAAEALLAAQWGGLGEAAAAGLLVKVNSELVPGVNEDELPAVARRAAGLGAHRHNIMPLLPRGRMADRPGPTREELARVQARAEVWLAQFRGCRQCRADAVVAPWGEGGELCESVGCGEKRRGESAAGG